MYYTDSKKKKKYISERLGCPGARRFVRNRTQQFFYIRSFFNAYVIHIIDTLT